jgi:hypothetical protein
MAPEDSRPWSHYHVPEAKIHHKSVGLTGGHHDLFMIDRIRKHFGPVRPGSSREFNRAE